VRPGLWEGWAAQAHLEGYGRATAVQLLAGGTLVQVVHHGGVRVGLARLAAVGIGFGCVQLNAVVVAVTVRLSSPEVRWRQLLGQRGSHLGDQPSRPHHAPLAVLIADLDRFKEVNDQHGHLVGDQVLAAAAAAFQSGSRSYDVLGRFGGEQFTIALPGTDVDEAAQITDRLRQLVGDAAVPVGRDCVQVTVSIGAAVLGRHGQDLTDLLVAADLALYRAKAAGRNQVSFAPTP
jgi:diguanylate cyclase (GGDEF)-like protein